METTVNLIMWFFLSPPSILMKVTLHSRYKNFCIIKMLFFIAEKNVAAVECNCEALKQLLIPPMKFINFLVLSLIYWFGFQ